MLSSNSLMTLISGSWVVFPSLFFGIFHGILNHHKNDLSISHLISSSNPSGPTIDLHTVPVPTSMVTLRTLSSSIITNPLENLSDCYLKYLYVFLFIPSPPCWWFYYFFCIYYFSPVSLLFLSGLDPLFSIIALFSYT